MGTVKEAEKQTQTPAESDEERKDQERKVSAIQRLKARKLVYDLKRLLSDAAESSRYLCACQGVHVPVRVR